MSTMSMPGASLLAGRSLAERHGGPFEAADESGLRARYELMAVRIAISRADGQTARGKPPMISASLIIAMQWIMFAACALRCTILAT